MHILVTGASGAIGQAIARAFAARGAKVSLVARRLEVLQALADELPHAVAIRADLSDPSAPGALLREAEAHFGPVDVLVNNAGVQYIEGVHQVNAERVNRLLNVNVNGPVQLMAGVLPAMVARGSGAVVNIASVAGIAAMPGSAHYSGSKAALASISEMANEELRPRGLHVLTVYPGPVASAMHAQAEQALNTDGLAARLFPTGDPTQLAERILYALDRKRARVIYPRLFAAVWWFPRLAQWLTVRLWPRPTASP